MPENQAEVITERPMSVRAAAFYDVLSTHMDAPVNTVDLDEAYPEIKWRGNVSMTWDQLVTREDLANRLVVFGEGRTTMYSMLSKDNDLTLLVERLQYIQTALATPDAHPKQKRMWSKRVTALGSVATLVAGGTALGVYLRHRRSSVHDNK